ncbi:MAG: response regulator [Geobacter sp.]|nr:response regulator [Geobacter sp.]
MKVLIVDDNGDDRMLLRLNLERHGCQPLLEASDGQEGLEMAKAHLPDLIISDALMPRKDGFQFLKAIKSDSRLRNIPFIFQSSVYTGMKDRELAISLGAEAFIPKGLEPQKFWDELTAVLQVRNNKTSPEAFPETSQEEYLLKYSDIVATKLEEKVEELEITVEQRNEAESALRQSEEQRYRLLAELACAADIQAKLLPSSYPDVPNFEIAARCLPAHQVGGDFYHWIEVAPGIIALTFGDIMGNGMTAAMLMATVRASVYTATLVNRPAVAVQLAARALRLDLAAADSFVTLFHGHLDVQSRSLTFVDCGHGYTLLRRSNGTVSELPPRGLPLGIIAGEEYQQGVITFHQGDTLVVYSDGLIDPLKDVVQNNLMLARSFSSATNAKDTLDHLMARHISNMPPDDDMTVLVLHCTG